jgi:hypothetical protein
MAFRVCLFFLLAVFVGSTARAQTADKSTTSVPQKAGLLRGSIGDPEGAAIQAFVLVHSDRWKKINAQVAVSKYGEFQIQLSPGLYDLFVASPGFLPIAQIVEIKNGSPTNLKLTMKIDEEHLQSACIS